MPPPESVSSAEVVIGISGTADAVVLDAAIEAVRSGIAEYLDTTRTRIVIAESDPALGQQYAKEGAHTRIPLTAVAYDVDSRGLFRLPYHGLPGRAHALRALLEAARDAGARACAVLDASLHQVTPDHVRWLVRPILDDQMDFVTPYYPRHIAEGAITKSILYPMFRTVFGCPIRQPAAREFGCSNGALQHLLAQRVWDEVGRDEAIDIWMTTEAVCGGLRVCEAQLAAAAPHGPGVGDASTALSQVAGSLFVELERRAALWQRLRSPVATCEVGPVGQASGPEPLTDVRQLIESFQLGFADLHEVWSEILPAVTVLELKALARAPSDRFMLDDRSWARIVYDFAVGHHLQVIRRDHLLGSLTPLYLGWLSSFVLHTQHACAEAVDRRLEAVYRGFEVEKPYLISRWRWPERFQS